MALAQWTLGPPPATGSRLDWASLYFEWRLLRVVSRPLEMRRRFLSQTRAELMRA